MILNLIIYNLNDYYVLIRKPIENKYEAIDENIIEKERLIIRDKYCDVSAIPSVEYLNPFIIQYSGLNNEIFLHNSGSISIDQNTPPEK